jgi:hypothetical protein
MGWPPLDLSQEFDTSDRVFLNRNAGPVEVIAPRPTPGEHHRIGIDALTLSIRNAYAALSDAREWCAEMNYDPSVVAALA